MGNDEVTHQTPSERREREREEKRALVLETARRLFVEMGPENVSMRDIAKAIAYTPTMIYSYFPSKEAVFKALCTKDFLLLREAFNTLVLEQDPIERLRKIGRGYIEFAMSHPNQYRLMFMAPHVADLSPEDLEKGNPDRDAYAFLKQAVELGLAADLFLPDLTDADLISQTLWGGVHGMVALQLTHGCDPWIEWRSVPSRSGAMVDALIRGILRDPALIQVRTDSP